MKVGHGSAPLPVPAGTPMGGYAARPGVSTGVLDELQVDCVTFATPRGRFALVVAEVLSVNEDLAAAVREALPVDDAWLCATHTHAGPDVGDGRTPRAWRRAIAAAAVAAAQAAIASERECAGRLHAGVLRDVGSPRGDERAEAAVGVDAVACVDEGGALLGVLAVVPVHPTVLPAASTLADGDLAGAIRRALARELGGPWVVVATGAAGDISTRRTRREQTPAECRRLGAEAARQIAALVRAGASALQGPRAWLADGHDALGAAGGGRPGDSPDALWEAGAGRPGDRHDALWEAGGGRPGDRHDALWEAGSGPPGDRHDALWEAGAGEWSADRRTLALPVRRRDPRALQTLRATLEDRRALELRRGAIAAARTAETALQGVAVAQARRPARTVSLALSAARVGRLVLLGIGAEPFHSFRELVRDRCDGPSVLLGYTNGNAGYLADEAAYATTGYEVLASPFRRDAGATAVASLIDLLPDPRRTE